jgi:hypothetical protein
MLFDVHVVSQADYQAHVAKLRSVGQNGQLPSGVGSTPADRQREYTLTDTTPAEGGHR